MVRHNIDILYSQLRIIQKWFFIRNLPLRAYTKISEKLIILNL